MKLIAIGDNVTDCYIDEGVYFPGGNAVNVAVNCKKNGVENVNYIGVFGNDERADYIKECLKEEGVTIYRARKVYAPTAQPKVCLINGDRVFKAGIRDTCQHLFSIKIVEEDMELIREYDICHTSCFSNLEYELPRIAEICDVSFDFSEHMEDAYLKRTCPYLSYAFFSGSKLTDEECIRFIKYVFILGTKIVGITRGILPAIFYDGNDIYYQDVKKVEAVDTMGAGDSFIAGFLSAYGNNLPMKEALNYAAEQSAKTCMIRGGFGHPHKL